MKAYRIETTLTESGKAIINGLPFDVGKSVEIIVLKRSPSQNVPNESNPYPLRGTVIHYHDPFAPAISHESIRLVNFL